MYQEKRDQGRQSRGQNHKFRNENYSNNKNPKFEALLEKISFSEPLDKDIFCETPDKIARHIKEAGKDKRNNPTQLRKFFDEIVLWNEKIQLAEEKEQVFNESLPFIRMIKAKAAYALGRETVSNDFLKLIDKGVEEIKGPKELKNFKYFMEAFMAYLKQHS